MIEIAQLDDQWTRGMASTNQMYGSLCMAAQYALERKMAKTLSSELIMMSAYLDPEVCRKWNKVCATNAQFWHNKDDVSFIKSNNIFSFYIHLDQEHGAR